MKIPAFLLYNYICENILENLEIIWYNRNIDFARLYFLNLRFEKYVILYESKTFIASCTKLSLFEKYVILYNVLNNTKNKMSLELEDHCLEAMIFY